MPAYVAKGLQAQDLTCVHMLMTCVRGTYSRTLTQKPETKSKVQTKKPNSNYLACLEHNRNIKLTYASI